MIEIPKADVPENRIGDYAVERFEVEEVGSAMFNAFLAMHGNSRFIAPGQYPMVFASCFHALALGHHPKYLWNRRQTQSHNCACPCNYKNRGMSWFFYLDSIRFN